MTGQDDHRLEAFFAAARAERSPQPSALYRAILADAATVSARRSGAEAAAPPRRIRVPWGAAGALAACAALGFWIGLVGAGDYGRLAYRGATAASDDAAAPVAAFFDLASAEG